jgi:hypothetical protein
MFNLIKYEWIRKWIYVVGALVAVLLLNIGTYLKGMDANSQIGSLLGLNSILFFISIIVLFVIHVRKMNKLLFSDEGQFTFLTPLNGYEILGSNLIGALLDIMLLLLTFGIIILVNFKLNDMEIIRQSIQYIEVTGINLNNMITSMLIGIFISYSLLLISIYLSMILVKTLFYNVKIKKILSFVVFIIVVRMNLFISEVLSNTNVGVEEIGTELVFMSLLKTLLIVLVWYGISGYLLEEKVSA